jgi:cob(I)alamin adenosyltransferase
MKNAKEKASLSEKKNLSAVKGKKGCIHIYTGNGKGKTTAALGLAIRAAGHGYKTFIGQFLKGQEYGEILYLEKQSSHIKIEQFGRKGFVHVSENPDLEDIQRAKSGLKKCLKAMLSNEYRIIILDEINVALHFNLLTEEDVHKFLDRKPEYIEVVLTGRHAPDSLIDRADLVTEMREIKHYYSQGIRARDGIEK